MRITQTIPFGKPMIGDEEREAVAEVLAGTTLTHGPRVKEFEAAFAEFTGAPHAIGTANCMAALHLCYLALGVGPGDEVIVPAQTHVATAHAVQLCGAAPVFCDCDPRTGNMDARRIAALIGERTRAIGLVHYLGLPVEMAPVMELAREHGLAVVEDCAVALGARVDGTHVGLIGDVGCFSFYPVKHITTGEGGMVITTRDDLAERVSRQRAFGIDKNVLADRRHTGAYDVIDVGLNYRLGEIGAAIGVVQMGRLPGFLEHRRATYRLLAAGLSEVAGLTVLESDDQGGLQASHYCLVAVLDERIAAARERVIDELKARGVGTSVYYPRALPDTDFYAHAYGHEHGSCPNATRISEHSIAFPVAPHVSEDDVRQIVETVKEVLADVES
ncbi:MAG TPA: DegT/DnrJ/EryC1/StrS family aminotransferase [Solirubrobacteraceae bacterium]|nr:DegT/DnrJ/EryC1/StrS family aminotransferase [Solirubrobacteraceae bacterium]